MRQAGNVLLSLLLVAACGDEDGGGEEQLVATEPEPAGDTCAGGGTAIHTGVDEDGDGELGADEVTDTHYVCNGEEAGHLVEVMDEPPGDNCRDGGVVVYSGVDADGDGALSDDEIEEVAYVCDSPGALDGIWFGDIGISSSDDAAQLAGIEQVTGNVVIDAPALTSLDLSNLRDVGGALVLRTSGMTELQAPDLERVKALFVYDGGVDGGIEALSLPSLRVVDGSIFLDESELESLDFTSLERVGSPGLQGNIEIYAPATETISFPSLEFVRDTIVIGWPALGNVTAPSLRRVQTLQVTNTEGLATLSLPLLESVVTLLIGDNLVLADLLLPALVQVSALTIQDNPVLPTCQATALAVQTGADSVTISGNDDGGSCD